MTQITDTNDAVATSGRDNTTIADPVHGKRPNPSRSKPGRDTRKQAKPRATKSDVILKKLAAPKGASIQTLTEATGWQAHSVRGFLSGTVKKKLGHEIDIEVGKDGTRRYRITNPSPEA